MANNFDIFKTDFLHASTWAQRKEGVPLDLLDKLSVEDLKLAETALINAASLHDDWPIIGLGHIKSIAALPKLATLLSKSEGAMKVKIAHAIFQISQDETMKDIVLETMPQISGETDLIDVLYYLPFFKDDRITALHRGYTSHKNYLVAYNATRYLGLPTNEVVERFQRKDS